MKEDSIITVASQFSVQETVDRMAAAAESQGFTIFARIDHAANAAPIGMHLRPTQLLIFGNPRVGTLLMLAKQVVGIDLPVKILAWEDPDSQVWVSYGTAASIAQRHDLGAQSAETIQTIEAVLTAVCNAVAVSIEIAQSTQYKGKR